MMLIVLFIHVLTAFWLIGGLLGRWLAFAQARRARDIRAVGALLGLSERFERAMVIPGSTVVLAFGLLAAWMRSQPLLGFLQGASANWLLASLLLSLSIVPIIAFVLAPRSKRRRAVLDVALEQGAVTRELRAALNDRAVLGGRAAELLLVGAVLVLMVAKPF